MYLRSAYLYTIYYFKSGDGGGLILLRNGLPGYFKARAV